MNIFVLDKNPIISASFHCDKHTVKMIVEGCQMLSTAYRMSVGVPTRRVSKTHRSVQHWRIDSELETVLYFATHVNHPSNVWVRASKDNYLWLHKMTDILCINYNRSTGKTHKSQKILKILLDNIDEINFSHEKLTPPTLAMPDEFKIGSQDSWDDVVASYRNLYNKSKSRFATFGKYNNPTPWWYKPEFTEDVNL